MSPGFEISWHRTAASSAVGTIRSRQPGALLSGIAVDGDWYLLPGTVSAALPHRFDRPDDTVTFLCFRRPAGGTEVPDLVLDGERVA